MPTASTVLMALAGVIALFAAAIYVFGIPPEIKRQLQIKALKVMGENKASYLVKGETFFSLILWHNISPY